MLSFMRNLTRSWFMRILMIALALTFLYFFQGSSDLFHTGINPRNAIQVNDQVISRMEFERVLEQTMRQYQRFAGDSGQIPEQFKGFFANQIIEDLIRRALFEQEAERLHVSVSDDELASKIMELPIFHQQGKFAAELYHRYNEQSGFEEEYRKQLSTERYRSLLPMALVIDPEDAKADYLASQTTLDLEYLMIDPRTVQGKVPIGEGEVKQIQREREADLRKIYEEQIGRFRQNDTLQPFEEVKDTLAREVLQREKANPHAQALAREINQALRSGKSPENLLKRNALTWQTAKEASLRNNPFGRDDNARNLWHKAFALDRKNPVLAEPANLHERWVVVRFKGKKVADEKAFEEERQQREDQLQERLAMGLLRNWETYLKRQATVTVAKDLTQPAPNQGFAPESAALPGE